MSDPNQDDLAEATHMIVSLFPYLGLAKDATNFKPTVLVALMGLSMEVNPTAGDTKPLYEAMGKSLEVTVAMVHTLLSLGYALALAHRDMYIARVN